MAVIILRLLKKKTQTKKLKQH